MITHQNINSTVFDRLKTGGDAVIKHGVVLPDEHPVDPSLYKVNIGDMTASASGRMEDGIWCTNAMTPFTRFRDLNNNPVSYGTYLPIVPYMPVTVIFPNGGAGQGMIIGPAKTNVGLPDPENREGLHMLAQTPKGSWIAMDDKTGNIQIFYEKGNSSIVLADNNISLEIGKGDASGKAHGTSISISEGSIIFRTRDSTMKLDESGFTMGFQSEEEQEKASSFSITRDSIKADAGKNMQFNASDSISAKAEKITFEGVKDASFVGNHVKINGAQLTSIKGNQIELEGFWNVQLKAMHIGVQANIKYMNESSLYHVKNYVHLEDTNGIAVKAAFENNTYTTIANLTFSNLLNATFPESDYTQIVAAAAKLIYEATETTMDLVQDGLKEVGQAFLLKNVAVSTVTNVLGTGAGMAAAGNRAENPSKFLFNARDTNNKKSLNSGIATSYAQKNQAMENLSVVDPLIQASMTALYTGGGSPATSVSPDTQWALEMGIGGIAEEATKQTGNVIGLDASGITMTDSASILLPQGTCATERKNISGCGGHEGTGEPKKCGEDAYNSFKEEEEKTISPFKDHLLTGHIASDGGGGSCGGSSSHGGDMGGDSHGGGGGSCSSGPGAAGSGSSPCPPGYTPDPGTGDCIVNGTSNGSAKPCTNVYSCPACPSGRRCSEGQCA